MELSERFYRGLFAGGVVFVGLAALVSLALLPLRASANTGGPPLTAIAAALLVAATPVAASRASALYRALRRSRGLEVAVVGLSAVLVAYPLRSEFWWPSCALLMLIAILAPLRRALGYCLVVLLTNLAAHLIAGDLSRTPAVAIVGLWIGFPFWSATFSVISDRLAAQVLRQQVSRPHATERVGVDTTIPADPEAPEAETHRQDASSGRPAPVPPPDGVMSRLTARQLQVTALLIDGLRYREVGACLSISERQVQRHVSNALARAELRTANELIAVAVSEGLAPPR